MDMFQENCPYPNFFIFGHSMAKISLLMNRTQISGQIMNLRSHLKHLEDNCVTCPGKRNPDSDQKCTTLMCIATC